MVEEGKEDEKGHYSFFFFFVFFSFFSFVVTEVLDMSSVSFKKRPLAGHFFGARSLARSLARPFVCPWSALCETNQWHRRVMVTVFVPF